MNALASSSSFSSADTACTDALVADPPARELQPKSAASARDEAGLQFSVEILTSLEAAAPVWLELEHNAAISSPFQRYAWASTWLQTIGAATGETPFIVVGRDSTGRPAFLWPLCRSKVGPLSVARFVGGKHSNANFPLWRPDFASALTAESLRAVTAAIARADQSVDVLVLLNQPHAWNGLPNPLALLPHETSPSKVCHGALLPDFDALYAERVSSSSRKKLRQKERSLTKHGDVRYWRVSTPDDAHRVLDAFFEQKAERMRQLGLADPFAEPGVRAFIEAATTVPDPITGTPPIELYAAAAGEQIAATFAGVVSGGRFCGMFNSMAWNELAKDSPGELLLANIVRMSCERGLTKFDLGIGEAGYKRTFCYEVETLFDALVPLTPQGRVVTPLWRAMLAAKRRIKHSPLARKTIESLRRRIAGRGPQQATE
jgi:CelD/BcsL family acetyltransferase involved in cellulose biosynthesis